MTDEALTPLERADRVDREILDALRNPGRSYWVALAVSALVFLCGMACWGCQMYTGMHVSGKNNPVGWYMYITIFVFWVGIAHSGTLISAILFLFRAKFRGRSIVRPRR